MSFCVTRFAGLVDPNHIFSSIEWFNFIWYRVNVYANVPLHTNCLFNLVVNVPYLTYCGVATCKSVSILLSTVFVYLSVTPDTVVCLCATYGGKQILQLYHRCAINVSWHARSMWAMWSLWWDYSIKVLVQVKAIAWQLQTITWADGDHFHGTQMNGNHRKYKQNLT